MFTFSVVDVRAVIARGHTDAAANGGFRDPHYGLLPDKDERHGLWIVGDEGVYVLSNRKLAEGQRALAVYADECDPKTNPDYRDYKRRYFGETTASSSSTLRDWKPCFPQTRKPRICGRSLRGNNAALRNHALVARDRCRRTNQVQISSPQFHPPSQPRDLSRGRWRTSSKRSFHVPRSLHPRYVRQQRIVVRLRPGRHRVGGCCHVKFLWLEMPAARGYSGDTGRNFPCIESFEPMVANCLRCAATGRNRKAIAGR